MEEIKKYLKHGKQTIPSDKITKLANAVPGDGFDFVVGTLDWLDKNLRVERNRPDWDKTFHKRTAAQIVDDGFSTGCTDVALVFVSLCRTKSIPTKYVEAIGQDWLEDRYKEGRIHGHAFAEVYLNDRWYVVDPEMGTIYVASTPYRFFEIYGTGLDTWDVGLHSFEEMRDKFLDFKKNYESTHL